MSSSADPKANRRSTLFSEVLKFSQSADYEKTLKSCNRLLHEFPDDTLAFQCKIISCIQLSKFQEALEFIGKNPKLSVNLGFEKAYCYYRLYKSREAYECLTQVKDNSFRKKELLAQISYRLGKYEDAYEIYKEVIKESSDEYDDERQTNLLAMLANVSQAGKKPSAPVSDSPSYEQLFNYGCCLVTQGKFKEAKEQFIKSEQACIETLREDGMADEEIEDEISAIKVQQAYCVHKLGNEKEALRIYGKALKNKPSNVEVAAIASNNVLAINRDQNIFESKKRLKAMHSEGVEIKITKNQEKGMLMNEVISLYLTNQNELCGDLCAALLKKFPDTKEFCSKINAGLNLRSKSIEEAIDSLERSNATDKLQIKLGLVQHILRQGKRKEAISLFTQLGDDKYRPGIVSAIVTLYQAENDSKAAAAILHDAINYYKGQGNKENLNKLWRQAAYLMTEQGDHSEAVKSLEELRKINKNDVVTVAQLIVAYSQHDQKKAKELSAQLPVLAAPEDLNMAELESPNWLSSIKITKRGTKDDQTTPMTSPRGNAAQGVESDKLKKKRKKKRKLPPNADGKVDPERWLPKYERAGYRPKKVRKGRVDVGKGTQGASAEQSAVFDMTSKSSKPAQTPPGSSTATPGNSGKSKSKGRKGK